MDDNEKIVLLRLGLLLFLFIAAGIGYGVFSTMVDREIQLDRNQKMLEAVKAWAK